VRTTASRRSSARGVTVAGRRPRAGRQAGPARIGAVVEEAGFGRFRTAAETASNLVFEARA